MKKTILSAYISAHFPIVAAAVLSLLFAFASVHYAAHYASPSTTQRLCAWFSCLHTNA